MKRAKKRGWLKAVILTALAVLVVGAVLAAARYPLKHLDIIRENAGKYGLDPAFVCAVIHTESKFRENALSPKGASGLMQITEPTADWIAAQLGVNNYSYDDIFEPSLNIKLGCYYLNWLLQRYGGDERLALAAYNAGFGNVDKWLRSPDYSADGNSLSFIPFQETRDFVQRVESGARIYGILINTIGRFI
ncbi:MAG: lytic transglycosylase domain-containing protein [Defluviitaleaceae bacterium]|nr:lytic transglycosylase domain-containing protein [Defluviitaleaceae bacterium]